MLTTVVADGAFPGLGQLQDFCVLNWNCNGCTKASPNHVASQLMTFHVICMREIKQGEPAARQLIPNPSRDHVNVHVFVRQSNYGGGMMLLINKLFDDTMAISKLCDGMALIKCQHLHLDSTDVMGQSKPVMIIGGHCPPETTQCRKAMTERTQYIATTNFFV